jgi:hypothetical protein
VVRTFELRTVIGIHKIFNFAYFGLSMNELILDFHTYVSRITVCVFKNSTQCAVRA